MKGAFKFLFNEGAKMQLPIVLSYASTSLVNKEDLVSIARNEGYYVEVLVKELMHSGQGQKRNKNVSEYLFICRF